MTNQGCIYYHGTDEKASGTIMEEGFKKGTYFTWDLHAALVMGGQYVFGVFFKDKSINDYWEFVTAKIIPPSRILYLRRFDVSCLFDNDNEEIKMKKFHQKQDYGNVRFCTKCYGHGQLNKARVYAWYEGTNMILCPSCIGRGYIK
jgi:hypothetical protein